MMNAEKANEKQKTKNENQTVTNKVDLATQTSYDDIEENDNAAIEAAETTITPQLPTTANMQAEATEEKHVSFNNLSSSLDEDENLRTFSSGTMSYDRDDFLITKWVKTLKKRKSIVPPADDSDDEPMPNNNTVVSTRAVVAPTSGDSVNVIDTNSDTIHSRSVTDSSSIVYSTTGSINFDVESSNADNRNEVLPPPGKSLESGLAFIYMVIPPDGGYGWFIVFISFLTQLIVDGIIFSIGILLPAMSKDLQVSEAEIVLVGSVQIGFYFISGTMSSALVNNYGFRPVASMGVCISCMALYFASYMQSLTNMILLYSVIGGPGLSMIWVSSQLIIGYYFESFRPLANGFSCSGAGAGTLIFSVLNNYLLNQVGWRNTICVHAVLLFMVFLLVLTYLEVSPTPVGVLHKPEINLATSSDEYYGTVVNFMRSAPASNGVAGGGSRLTILEYYHPKVQKHEHKCFRRWLDKCIACLKCKKKSTLNTDDLGSPRTEEDFVVRNEIIQRKDIFYTGPVEYDTLHSKENLDGKEIELHGNQKLMLSTSYGLTHIHDYNEVEEHHSYAHLKRTKRKHPVLAYISPKNWLHPKIQRALFLLCDFHLFKVYEFRLLILSSFLFPMGFNIPFVYAKSRTTIPPEYAQFIQPAIGLSNFTMRIICGFLAYKYKSFTTNICGGGLLFGGSMVFLSAIYGQDKIWFQLLYGICYGVAPAVFSTLRAIIYVHYLGLNKLTNAFGIAALAMGLGVFIGTTAAGLLNQFTGSYTAAFLFAGICIMMSGILKLAMPYLSNRRQSVSERN